MDKIVLGAACAGLMIGVATAALAATAISQKDRAFSQDSVTVDAGERIKFVNDDNVIHNINVTTPGGGILRGGQQKPGDEIELAFDEVGSYLVRCLIHPRMKLSVEVR